MRASPKPLAETKALYDADPRAATLAAQKLTELAIVGGHIELAVPALLLHRAHADLELRRLVWAALSDACGTNNPTARVQILESFARVASSDADERVRTSAQRALTKLEARRPAH